MGREQITVKELIKKGHELTSQVRGMILKLLDEPMTVDQKSQLLEIYKLLK